MKNKLIKLNKQTLKRSGDIFTEKEDIINLTGQTSLLWDTMASKPLIFSDWVNVCNYILLVVIILIIPHCFLCVFHAETVSETVSPSITTSPFLKFCQ